MGKKIIDLYPHSTKLLKKIEIEYLFGKFLRNDDFFCNFASDFIE